MSDTAIREEIEKEWWDAWWKADYSWEGLAKHRIHLDSGSGLWGESTLHGYWRIDPETGNSRTDEELITAGELEPCDGKLFHIAHLPPHTCSGEPTWKNDFEHQKWVALGKIIAWRIKAARRTPESEFHASPKWFAPALLGRDGRARLDGAVLLKAVHHDKRHGREGPILKRQVDSVRETMGYGEDVGDEEIRDGMRTFMDDLAINICCDRTAFLGETDYNGCQFGPATSFEHAAFMETASFLQAAFQNDANFSACTFMDKAFFFDTHFRGFTTFCGARFHKYASFDSTKFLTDCRFDKASFTGKKSPSMSGAEFLGDVKFCDARVGSANFDLCRFAGHTDFSSTTFDYGGFWRANFEQGSDFSGSKFLGEVHFALACFKGESNFSHAEFHQETRFENAHFAGTASFNGAQLAAKAMFSGTHFSKEVSFRALKRTGEENHNEDGWDCRLDFSHARFDGFADFRNGPFPHLAGFYGAQFAQGMDFGPVTEKKADSLFKKQLTNKALSTTKDGTREQERQNRDRERHAVECGARLIKQEMAKLADKTREQMFYRYELHARHAQSTTPLVERFVGCLYRRTSNYGDSIASPIGWLFVGSLLMAIIYGAWFFLVSPKNMACISWSDFGEAVNLSFSRIFPFGPWAVEKSVMYEALQGGSTALGFRIVATFHSIVGAALLFLSALSIKRRFQIR